MKPDNKANIIKKLIRGELTKKEQDTLLHSHPVEEEMQSQWNDAPDMAMRDKADGTLIWKRIRQEAWLRIPVRKVRFYKIYSWAVSIALLMGFVGTALYMMNRQGTESMYVVSAGIRSIESVTLPDGTSVRLGSGSVITYPAEFTGTTRTVKLDGQAFFDVRSDLSKPFIVQTASMNVEALGTAFELFCYDERPDSEAVLLNGKIKVNIINTGSDKLTEVILNPNDKIEYNASDKKVVRSVVNAETYTSWRKRGGMSFENEKLAVIIPRFEEWYGRTITCDPAIASNYRFTFKVVDESLEFMLDIMSKSSPIRYLKTEEGDYDLFLKK